VAPGGKKLSKRRDSVSVQDFRDAGYLPEAIVNWLVRIGWSHGDQEVFSAEEISSLFDFEAVSRSSALADPAKLQWLNQHYIKTLPREALIARLLPSLEAEAQRPVPVTPALEKLVDLLRDRSKTLAEMAGRARFLVADEVDYEEKASRKHLKPEIEPVLRDLHDCLAGLEPSSEAALEAVFDQVRVRHGDLPMGKLAQPVRVAITGGAASPGIFETLAVLGKPRSVGRIAQAIRFLRQS